MVAPFATPPRFLEATDPDTDTTYVLHTEFPRILAKLDEDTFSLTWVQGWGDEIPIDYPAAKLMREMGDWYAGVLREVLNSFTRFDFYKPDHCEWGGARKNGSKSSLIFWFQVV